MRLVDRLFPQAKRVESIDIRKCIEPPFGCGKPIIKFKDNQSEKEYQISGMCQECQDSFFKEESWPWEDEPEPNDEHRV